MRSHQHWILFSLLTTSGYSGLAAAASLDTYAGGVGGLTNGSINAGCFTRGTPIEPGEPNPFFGLGPFPAGGIGACGLTGGLNHNTASAGAATSTLTVAPVKVGGPNNPAAGYYSGQANAIARYGSLGVSAQGSFQNGKPDGSPGIYNNTVAAAKFTDTLTASSTSFANGSAGFVRYAFDLHGTTSALGTPAAYYTGETRIELLYMNSYQPVEYGWGLGIRRGNLGLIQNTTPPAGWTTSTSYLSGGSTFYSFDLPIIWGQSWDLTVGFIAYAYGEASADFLGTAKLTGVQVFDSSHNEVTNFSLLSASGTNYLAAPVPEPETYAMLLAGLGLMGAMVKRKRLRNAHASRTLEQPTNSSHPASRKSPTFDTKMRIKPFPISDLSLSIPCQVCYCTDHQRRRPANLPTLPLTAAWDKRQPIAYR